MHSSDTNDSAVRGARIRALRLSLQLSQSTVARELGWTQPRISSYECGLLPFSEAMELRIVEAIHHAASKGDR